MTTAYARISQEVIEVVNSTEAYGRVSQLVVEAIYRNPGRVIGNKLDLLQSVSYYIIDTFQDASNTLVLNQFVNFISGRFVDANNTLTLSQTASAYNNRRAGTTLRIRQTVSCEIEFHRSLTSTLTFTQPSTLNKSLQVHATSTLSLVQHRSLPFKSVGSILTFSQKAVKVELASSALILTQDTTALVVLEVSANSSFLLLVR